MIARALVAVSVLTVFVAIAQTENDDVYFTRKDRKERPAPAVKVKKEEPVKFQLASNKTKSLLQKPSSVGYTGRTINPDYQSNYEEGVAGGYFDANYEPSTSNAIYTAGNVYPNSGWGMNRLGFNGMYSPFASSWGMSPFGFNNFNQYGYGWNTYDPWGYNAWNNPYYGWGNSFYGNTWGWGMNSGWGMSSGWGLGFGWGNGLGWGNNFYNTRPVVVVTRPDNTRNQVYGKRSSRNDGYVNPTAGRGTQTTTPAGNPNRGGRTAATTTSTGQRSYYQRGWRQDPSINPSANTSTTPSGGGSRSTGRSIFDNDWGGGNTNWNTGSFGGGGSRSSSSGGFSGGGSSGGSRSSGSAPSGGGGGSRSSGGTRGRN